MSLTAIDLFCGCGGTTVGLKSAGFQVLCGLDNAESPARVYKANHPDVPVIKEDIAEVDCKELAQTLKLRPGELSLLAGCPPCQGFSSMRTRNGKLSVDDLRNSLIHQFARFTECFLPQSVMLENVPGLKDSEEFESFLATMQKLGYEGSWRVLNAKHFGVPQSRRRLIYVAGHKRKLKADVASSAEVTVREAFASLPPAGGSGDPLHDMPERRTARIRKMISLVPKDGGSRSDLPKEYMLECHSDGFNGYYDVYGRMSWEKPSPTITGGCASPSKGRFLHPEEDRCITLREAAVLQGFPIDYNFPGPLNKADLALMIGNALPAPFIKAHAEAIAAELSVTKA